MYAILILFPNDNFHSLGSSEEQLILDISELSLQLASSGLALPEETNGDEAPLFQDWTLMAAKRRTILIIYMITYAWSVQRNYPTFHCFELHLMYAPASRSLWQAQTDKAWLPLYLESLSKWKHEGYRIGEMFSISPTGVLDKRTEAWLEEVDEFGMLLMSLGKNWPQYFDILTLTIFSSKFRINQSGHVASLVTTSIKKLSKYLISFL